MQCAEVQRFIDAYIDGEFADEDRAEIDRHFEACETCRAEALRQQHWKSLVRARLARPAAPYGLHQRISRALDAETAPQPLWKRVSWRFAPAVVAAGALAALILTVQQPRAYPWLEQGVFDHTHNLPVEVASPNPDEVANWFQGKVDFPVRVPRFGGDARLLGARIGHLGAQHAAYLVYSVQGGHKVSVYVFDPGEVQIPAPRRVVVPNRQVYMDVERGYRVAVFRDQGIGYAVYSDLDEPQMVQMVSHSFR